MSQSTTFKCPSCGAYLEFDPDGQSFVCPYCHATFSEEELREQSERKAQDAAQDRAGESAPSKATEDGSQGALRSYHCQNCGAEIVVGDTTAAARCYYCHSPVVLADRLDDAFKPDGVIPFQLDKEKAEEAFRTFIDKKKFIDRRFFSPDQLENFSGVYYPYWVGDVDGSASFEGNGSRISTQVTPRETITVTRHFRVSREGTLHFGGMFRKALKQNDRKLSDGIHPYDEKDMKPFAMGYLSGFLAEKRDVPEQEAEDDMTREAEGYADGVMKEGASFDTLSGSTSFTRTAARLRYVLLPTWVLTYRGDQPGATYFYMMNGQTGTVCGKLPVKKSKLALWSLCAGALVAGLLMMGGALLW